MIYILSLVCILLLYWCLRYKRIAEYWKCKHIVTIVDNKLDGHDYFTSGLVDDQLARDIVKKHENKRA